MYVPSIYRERNVVHYKVVTHAYIRMYYYSYCLLSGESFEAACKYLPLH